MKDKQRGASAAKGRAAPAEKSSLHPRNPHRGRYDFRQLIACSPELAAFVATNEYGDESIAFADPVAVKALNRMIEESAQLRGSCLWFTTLVSKSASLPGVYRALKRVGVLDSRTIEMAQGQKKSRVVAWTFLDENRQRAWRMTRWK